MAVRTVLRMGHPLLLQVAAPVERFGTAELRQLVADMDDTMRVLNGAGIAAPQIGVSLRAVIFEVTPRIRRPARPGGRPRAGRRRGDGLEGCLSVPGLRGIVARHTKLRYRGFDLDGRPIDRTVTGFHARVVQHEADHLDGILYPMRVADLRSFGFEDELFPDRSALPPD
ncbi:MAG: peptide deformylase [Proteobacteria bacterium]|nr:peptide deformylase [Pseudomonadota bacterium]